MATSKVTVYFSCPVERLWYAVTDLTNTGWRSDLTGVEIRDEAHFVEHGRSGRDIHFTVTDCEPPHFWAFTMENSSMSGSWEGSFESAEGAPGSAVPRPSPQRAGGCAPLCPDI